MQGLLILVILLVVVPLFFWYRVKTINQRKNSVTVKCPHCNRDQRLSEVANYSCVKCNGYVVFFEEDGSPKKDAGSYKCRACGWVNFKGVVTCTGCGLANQTTS